MKKNKRKRAIAVLLTAALMLGVIKENDGLLMALETFSGVKEMVNGQINGNRDFVILEIVDDASEASVGYLVSGQEPNADQNRIGLDELNSLTNSEYTELLDKLRRQGLLAVNDNDDQSSYPIEHRVTERKYSDKSGETEGAGSAEFQGYRERGLAVVSGYYEPVKTVETNKVYYYRLDKPVTISTMTQEELEKVTVELMRSYRAEGYRSGDLNGGQFFTFSMEEPDSDGTELDVSRSDGAVIHVSIDLDRSVLVVSTDEGAGIGGMMGTGADDADERTSAENAAGIPDAAGMSDVAGTPDAAGMPDVAGTPDAADAPVPGGMPNLTDAAGPTDSAQAGETADMTNPAKGEQSTDASELEEDGDSDSEDPDSDLEDMDSEDPDSELEDLNSENSDSKSYAVSYEWTYDAAKGGAFYCPQWVEDTGCSWDELLSGLELQDVVFIFKGTQYDLKGIKNAIQLPEDDAAYASMDEIKESNAYQSYPENATVTVKGKIKNQDGVASSQRTDLGTYTFSGWTQKNAEDSGQGEGTAEEKVILAGTWTYTSTISENICKVTYQFAGVDANGHANDYFIPSNLRNGGMSADPIGESDQTNISLKENTVLPNDALVGERGAILSRSIRTPEVENVYLPGDSYSIEDETTAQAYHSDTVIEVTVNGEPIGKYTFSGWTQYKDAEGVHDIPEDGVIENLNGDITIIGTWTYAPVNNVKYITGYGYQHEYIQDELVNHDWFKYYVLGLEESQWGSLNVKVATYTPDGRHVLGADFGSLTEAMNRADLVVLNADGRYVVVDDKNHTAGYEETGKDISSDVAKVLLARACANEQAQRLAVVVDHSVLDAKMGNMKKIAVLLQQPDIGRAYEDFTASAKFEDDYDGADWISLRRSVKSLNNGNFVRENIYIVNYQRSSFKGTTYRDIEADDFSVFSLVNADFENQYSDSSVDSGFADVYRAILNENYTRGQNSQKSMDEYVTPAVSVAYILNYRNYDPVIYKDQIRVLELEPCMDFTYYYPGRTDTDAGRKAKEDRVKLFIKDWAPSFAEKYAQNPSAVVIDGMTTAEFCGKIADVYEDYDLIYFGSNTGLLNTTGSDYYEWQERNSCPETIRNVKGFYYVGSDGLKNEGLYSYIGGQWYVSFWTKYNKWTAKDEWIEISGTEVKDVEVGREVLEKYNGNGGWTWAISHGNGAWQWRWNWEKQNWQLRAEPTWNPADRVVPYEWVDDTPDSYSIDRILKAQAESTDNLKYQYKNGRWFRHPTEDDGTFWMEEKPCTQPAFWETLYSRENEIDSDWKWVGSGEEDKPGKWYQKVRYSGKPVTLYNDPDMNGMVYTHIGDFFTAGEGAWFDYGGLLETETVDGKTVSRYSGNDILEWQVDELLNFLKSGSPIIVANDFMTYDNQGNISGINTSDVSYSILSKRIHGILDTSSYVYRFVQKACDAGYFGKGLLLEGTHGSEDTAVALNQQKLRLNLFSMPEPYAYTETADELGAIVGCTYLQPESDGKYYLNYEFSITDLNARNPLTTRYDVKLFLDSNNDGIYNTATEELGDITVINAQTGVVQERISGAMDAGGAAVLHYSLSAGTPYTVRRELPQGYVGAIGWKLTATQVGNTGIHDSAIGLTAVQKQRIYGDKIDPVTGKRIINVLQIVKDNNVTLNLEECMEKIGNRTESDDQWKILLESIPDFIVRFDSISEEDFAYSFDYEDHPDHYCARHASEYDEKEGHLVGGPSGWWPEYGGYTGLRDNYLNFYDYDMVILGFGDEYGNLRSKKATEALLAYGDSGKSLLYTHDTTYSHSVLRVTEEDFTNTSWEIGSHTSTLSMSIRNQCGMDRFGVSLNRFNGQYNPIRKGAEIALTGQNEVLLFNSADNDRLGSDIAYKPGSGQSVMAAQTQGFTYVGMNVGLEGYANLDYSAISSNGQYSAKNDLWMKMQGAENNNIVTRVNSGIITQYPYNVGGGEEEIVVSNTHAQYFQVDLDTDWDGDGRGDIVVWYCISSLDNTQAWNAAGEFKPNDIYDYSPNDVRNNYYIYNKGNITYTGVGHDRNFTIDEMKLFINTFIAAYNAGIHDPSVRIVDGASTNAPDLESVSIPFMAEDAESAGTQRVYYQVEDHNITTGTANLYVTYYLEGGSSKVEYEDELISAELYAGNPDPAHPEKKALQTYDARTGEPVSYDAIRSGRTYYIDVPLNRLLDRESFNLYVKIDLKLDGSDISAASDVDRLLIAKLKMFKLD